MKIIKKATRENLPKLLHFVEQACQRLGIPEETSQNLQLAVDEACINIIDHGYQGRSPGTIELTIQVGDQQVVIEVVDFGRKFDPTTLPTPDISSSLEERPVGGLGVYLMMRLMDEVHYSSDPEQGNCLQLIAKFGITPEPDKKQH